MEKPEGYREAVYEIQSRLRKLHFVGYPVDLLIPDGIYDDSTRTAVIQFQNFVKLPATGIVDKVTWEELDAVYLSAVFETSRPAPLYAFPETIGYTVKLGEVSDTVMIIQIILDSLDSYFDGMHITVNGKYDDATLHAVELFQKRSGTKVTGEVDKETWNSLATLYNKVNNIYT